MSQPAVVSGHPLALVQDLAAMDPETFSAYIRDRIGADADPEEWEALTSAPVIARTKAALGSLDRDLLGQLSEANRVLEEVRSQGHELGEEGRETYFRVKGAQADWRRRVTGFRRLVLRRMAQVRDCTAMQQAQRAAANPPAPPGWGKRARIHNRKALEQLARAVQAHQRAVLNGGDEDDDEALWDALESITAMTARAGELPLAEWLEYLEDQRDEEQGD